MKTTAPWWITTCLISLAFVGCSSTNTDNGTTPPPTGTGGFGATGSFAGTSAGAGGAGVTSVPCGATTCTNPAGALLSTLKMFLPSAMLATPCCDTATTTCGWVVSGACTIPPPKKNCPAPAAIPGIGAGLNACCMASSNTCGVDAYAIGMGCMASFGGGVAADCDTGVAPGTGTAGSSAAGSSAAGTGAAGAAGAAGAHAGASGGSAGSSAGSGAAGAHAGSGGSGTAGTHAGAGGH